MKPHRILKDFPGSQDGITKSVFREGQTELLSDSLAAIVVREGWAEAIEPSNSGGEPIEIQQRDTKVIVPEERKPLKIRKK